MGKLVSCLKIFVFIILVLLGLGLGIESVGYVPDYAIVYLNKNTNEYYSPLILTQEIIDEIGLEKSTLKKANELGFTMSEVDYENDHFHQKGRSLTGKIFEDMGVLPEFKDRVDNEGNWRY